MPTGYSQHTVKICRLLLRIIAVVAMAALFLWQASVALQKYQSKVTSMQVRPMQN